MQDAEDIKIEVGDIVSVLYKHTDGDGDIIDVARITGIVKGVDIDFGNKYPYNVAFVYTNLDNLQRPIVSCFMRSEVTFLSKPNVAPTVTEETVEEATEIIDCSLDTFPTNTSDFSYG